MDKSCQTCKGNKVILRKESASDKGALITCWNCQGSGLDKDSCVPVGYVLCPTCEGRNLILRNQGAHSGGVRGSCTTCGGYGRIEDQHPLIDKTEPHEQEMKRRHRQDEIILEFEQVLIDKHNQEIAERNIDELLKSLNRKQAPPTEALPPGDLTADDYLLCSCGHCKFRHYRDLKGNEIVRLYCGMQDCERRRFAIAAAQPGQNPQQRTASEPQTCQCGHYSSHHARAAWGLIRTFQHCTAAGCKCRKFSKQGK